MRIDSPDNPKVRAWRQLSQHKGRQEAGLFLVEGPHLVEEAIRTGAGVESLLVESGRGISPLIRSSGLPMVEVSARVMKALSETVNNQGLAAICRLPAGEGPVLKAGRYLLLDGVQDPGNVGSMLRTAAAAALDAVVVGVGTADPYSPKVTRASQGAIFRVPMAVGSVEEWLAGLRAAGVRCLAADGATGRDFRELGRLESFGLVIGNEGAGLRPEVLALCDERVRVPMPGGIESLGAPVAAGILLYGLMLDPGNMLDGRQASGASW